MWGSKFNLVEGQGIELRYRPTKLRGICIDEMGLAVTTSHRHTELSLEPEQRKCSLAVNGRQGKTPSCRFDDKVESKLMKMCAM